MREPIQQWITRQVVGDEMLWKGSWGHQLSFLRDALQGVATYGLRERDIAVVISTHRSKSIELPVVRYRRQDLGLDLIVRNNFYNWKLSVISEEPIRADFTGLFQTSPPEEPEYSGNKLHPVYFEGFPRELVFGYLDESDGRKWSAELGCDHSIWTAFFLIMRDRGAIPPRRAHTKESHHAEMERDKLYDALMRRDEWSPMKTVGML